MLDLQSPGLKTLDRWFRSSSMPSAGKDLLHISQECGETHGARIRDRMVPRGETPTEKGALAENSEGLACCKVRDGMEQE